ncbi:MAG: YfhO family protein [Bacteroidetes bacterium]|nr:YfhO family protein [Bacteroidota bacterium]
MTFTIIIAIVGLILGGFTGLEKLFTLGFNKANQNKLLIAFAVTGGFALLATIFAGMGSYVGGIDARLSGSGYPDWLLEAIRLDRESLLRADAFRSFVFVALAFVTIYFGLKNNSVLKYSIMGIAFLVLIDMFFVDRRYLDSKDFTRNPEREFFAETAADKLLKTDPDNHFRVLYLPNPFNDARTSYHHRSIGGYHGAKLRRYQDIVENHLDTEMNELIEMVKAGNTSFTAQGVLNMLDTRYFIAGLDQKGIIPNGHANGAAWFVQAVKKVSSPDEELVDIGNANTKMIAVVDTTKFEVHDSEGYFTAGTIDLVQNYPNHLVYNVDASGQVFAIFSEIYYPEGWIATINGIEAPIIRANYLLRALEIPQGKHKVEFKFEPASYVIGNKIMMSFGLLMLIGALAILGFEIKRSMN